MDISCDIVTHVTPVTLMEEVTRNLGITVPWSFGPVTFLITPAILWKASVYICDFTNELDKLLKKHVFDLKNDDEAQT